MPKKKDYPKWFNYYGSPREPYKPGAPLEYIDSYTAVHTEDLQTYDAYSKESFLNVLNRDFDRVEFIGMDSYGDVSFEMSLQKNTKKENPYYKRAMIKYDKSIKKYEEELESHKIKLKEWRRLKRKWNKEVKVENEIQERKELKRLMKKFG